jgi:hypothetical protein
MKLKMIRLLLAATASLILMSCASGYTKYYKSADDAKLQLIAAQREAPPPASPILERSAVMPADQLLSAYAKRGYTVLGASMFNSDQSQSEEAALEQGHAVGADLVLVFDPKYTGSVTTSIPITIPTATTSYTHGSATAVGPSGTATAYGNATTTTYGTQTTYIPMTVNRSDYGAVYFVKLRFSLGAMVRDLNDGERKELQTNQGVVVLTVADDSPAFTANILPGDIVTAIDGVTVPNQGGFRKMTAERKGKLATLTLVRNGQQIEKSVQLNN